MVSHYDFSTNEKVMFIRHQLAIALHGYLERNAEKKIKANLPLWNLLKAYIEKSPSTGCSFSDYLVLYNYVKKHKPKEILECGTGMSTVVLAYALKENYQEGGVMGRVASMEEDGGYYEKAMGLFPDSLKEYAEIFLSSAVEDTRDFFRGVRYKDIPNRKYDFVFVDGPDLMINPKNPELSFDYDIVRVIANSDTPVAGFVDTRTSTCFIYSLIFGDKFRYDYVRKLGIVEPCTKKDVLSAKKIADRATMKHAFKRPSLLKSIRGSF